MAEVIPVIWIILDAADVRIWKDITTVSETELGEDQLENRDGKYENDICGSMSTRSVGKMSGDNERNTPG